MPIECNVYKDGEIFRQKPIEPGKYHSYSCDLGSVGRVILATCHDKDRGGLIFNLEDKEWAELDGMSGHITDKDLEPYRSEVLGTGHTGSVLITTDSGVETLLIFTHMPMN